MHIAAAGNPSLVHKNTDPALVFRSGLVQFKIGRETNLSGVSFSPVNSYDLAASRNALDHTSLSAGGSSPKFARVTDRSIPNRLNRKMDNGFPFISARFIV